MGKDRPRRARHRILQFGAKTAGFLGVWDARGSDAVTHRPAIIPDIVELKRNSWWRRLERKLRKSARRRRLVKRCPPAPARRPRQKSLPPRKARPRQSARGRKPAR